MVHSVLSGRRRGNSGEFVTVGQSRRTIRVSPHPYSTLLRINSSLTIEPSPLYSVIVWMSSMMRNGDMTVVPIVRASRFDRQNKRYRRLLARSPPVAWGLLKERHGSDFGRRTIASFKLAVARQGQEFVEHVASFTRNLVS